MSKKDKSKNKDENIKESETVEQQDTIDKIEENEIPQIDAEEVDITAV